MSGLLALSRGIDWFNMWFGRLSAVLVLAAALISAGNAVVRYLFDYSSNAYLEIQWYLFAAVVLLGAAETLRQNGHVRVDLVYMSVSERKRLWIDVWGIVLFLLPFTLFMIWLCLPVAIDNWRRGEMSTNSGGLVRWPVWAILVLGFVLLTLQGVSELIKRIAALQGRLVIETSYEKPQQ